MAGTVADARLCRECGTPIDVGLDFCSWCGAYCEQPAGSAPVPDGAQQGVSGGEFQQADPYLGREDLRKMVEDSVHQLTIVMLLIWVFMSLFEGIGGIIMAGDESVVGRIMSMSPGYEKGMIESDIITLGTILVASGLLALFSVVLCRRKRLWRGALLACVASASVMVLPAILFSDVISFVYVMMGVVVSLRIWQGRGVFAD